MRAEKCYIILRDMYSLLCTVAPQDIIDYVAKKTGSRSKLKVRDMLKSQVPKVLAKVKHAFNELQKHQSEEELKRMEKAKAIGLCPMGFDVS